MNYLFEIATILFTCLLIHIFFNAWFGTRSRKRSKMAIFMAAYFLLHSFVSLLPISPPLRAAVSCFIVFGIASILYETALFSAIYSSLLFVALAVMSEYLCFLLMGALGLDTGTLMPDGNERAAYLALAKTVHFVVVLIAASILRKNHAALNLRQIAPLLPCLVVSIYICIVFFVVFPDREEDLSLMLVIALTGLLYINGVIVLNTQSIKNAVFELEEQRLARRHYEIQERYYRNALMDREETRALWHDINKHLTAIEALVGARDNQQAEDEYARIRQAFDELGHVVDTENPALNAILHHNISRAKANNISVNLDARIPPDLPISAVDLSVIIGNTFDNAIEECTALADADPRISVSLVQRNKMLFYEIANPCMHAPHKKEGKLHGYGLGNVRRCVDKYDGSMENGMADGQYRVSIRLNSS